MNSIEFNLFYRAKVAMVRYNEGRITKEEAFSEIEGAFLIDKSPKDTLKSCISSNRPTCKLDLLIEYYTKELERVV